MVFSSLNFIFRFLPVFFVIYFLAPVRYRNFVLLAGSLIFYALGDVKSLPLLVLSVFANYFLGRAIGRNRQSGGHKKLLLVVGVCFNAGMLLFFKYSNFVVHNAELAAGREFGFPEILLPIGISFYTFQSLGYLIDVYMKRTEYEKSFVDFGTYLCMFPKLLEGPIVSYSRLKRELRPHRVTVNRFEEGLRIFILGLGSKILLANNFGQVWGSMAGAGYESLSTPMAWMGAAAYTLQIYFDFNGYTLMAIGLGNMLGFKLPRNFNHPYTAHSVSDFWKRWHMTLTDWFRTYIYIPLGGNRKGMPRTICNMFVVWLLTGFWHGASWNFVLWGLYYFVLLTLERLFLGKMLEHSRILSRIYTIFAVMCGWVIFAVRDLQEIGIYFSRMFTFHWSADFYEPLAAYGLLFVPGILLSTPVFLKLYERQKKRLPGVLFLLVVFWASVVVMVDSVYSPFLYFGF